jgi:DNA polymerase IV
MNSYFATAEQQANPYLRGKPIGIIKAAGRGCVIAASVEAKKYGVKTGCNVWEAKKLCPQIIFVPSDMEKYFSLTQRMIKIARDYSPTVEVFSIDEVFADVAETQSLYAGGALEIAIEIKQRLKLDLGEWMRCSIGIGFSKIIAKLASEMQKPDGLTWLTPEDYLQKTQKVAVEEVCGIGRSRTKYLHDRGAFTLGQARKLELSEETKKLVWLEDDSELSAIEDLIPAKSVSRTFTTYAALDDEQEILKLIRNLVEEAAAKLREMGMVGRTFCLSLDNFWVRKTVDSPTDDPLIIFSLLASYFAKGYEGQPVRQVGVWISNLTCNAQCKMYKNRDELLKAVDRVNEKYGLFTAYPASLLGNTLIRPEVTGFLGDKWYRFGGGQKTM